MNLSKIINDNWNCSVQSITNAPRQFVAETYFVQTDKGEFFCKVIDKPLFIPGVINSLPTLKEVHELGFDRLNYPVPTNTNQLYMLLDNTLIVLFNFIDASQSYNYDNYTFGKLFAELHQLSSKITASINKETFDFKHANIFKEKLANHINLVSDSETEMLASKLLKSNNESLLTLYTRFEEISDKCKQKSWEMVITHGDAPGNVLVKSPQDLYIIDWDDILLAPAERDTWFLQNNKDFLDGYNSISKDYTIDSDATTYYLFSRYFNDLIEYWAEIFGSATEDHKLSNFNQMKKELFEQEGWLYPQIKKYF